MEYHRVEAAGVVVAYLEVIVPCGIALRDSVIVIVIIVVVVPLAD